MESKINSIILGEICDFLKIQELPTNFMKKKKIIYEFIISKYPKYKNDTKMDQVLLTFYLDLDNLKGNNFEHFTVQFNPISPIECDTLPTYGPVLEYQPMLSSKKEAKSINQLLFRFNNNKF